MFLLSPIFLPIGWRCRIHRLLTCRRVRLPQRVSCSQVGWGCRIHRLNLCKGLRPPTNESPGYDTKQSNTAVSVTLELWGMRSIPSLPSLPGPLLKLVQETDKVQSMDQIELNCVVMLTWIVWNGTVFWHLNCVLTQNGIVCNRTVFDFDPVNKQKTIFILHWIF